MIRPITIGCMLLLAACAPQKKEIASSEAFKRLSTDTIAMYSIQNKNGMKMSVTNFGGENCITLGAG